MHPLNTYFQLYEPLTGLVLNILWPLFVSLAVAVLILFLLQRYCFQRLLLLQFFTSVLQFVGLLEMRPRFKHQVRHLDQNEI